MSDEIKKEQVFELPAGSNGLPDLLLVETDQWSDQAIVRAFIVPSAKESKGYWGERFNAEGEDGAKWARLFAMERVREHFQNQHNGKPPAEQPPFELREITDWDTLSVRRSLGFYPTLRTAAGNANGVGFVNLFRMKDTAPRVETASLSYSAEA